MKEASVHHRARNNANEVTAGPTGARAAVGRVGSREPPEGHVVAPAALATTQRFSQFADSRLMERTWVQCAYAYAANEGAKAKWERWIQRLIDWLPRVKAESVVTVLRLANDNNGRCRRGAVQRETATTLAWSAIIFIASATGSILEAADTKATVPIPVADLVAAIDNRDVKWDGTYIGLLPRMSGASCLIEKHCGKEIAPNLLTALDDPSRFIAAHVLLGQLTRTPVITNGEEYDGLKVELFGDGRTHISPDQRTALKQRWIERLGATKK